MARTREKSALTGAAIGTAIFPGIGTAVGGLIGLSIGFGQEATEEQDRARDQQRSIQLESEKFQAAARAQRLSLLQTGRRFSEGSSTKPSALSSAVDQPVQPQASVLSSLGTETGSSSAGTF